MKLKEIEKVLFDRGYILKRISKHRIYSNGIKTIAIPQHKELNHVLCKRLLKEIG